MTADRLPRTELGRRLLASHPLIGTWTVESLADMIVGIEDAAGVTLDPRPARTVFTFPDGTTGPGRWDSTSGTVVPDAARPEPDLTCCEYACYEDPGCACEGCRPSPDTALLCGCTADTELGMSSGCPICGHRDHGRSGCRAALEADHE